MARFGTVDIDWNDSTFEGILRSAGVKGMCAEKAAECARIATTLAPVGDPATQHWYQDEELHPGRPGDYRASIRVEVVPHAKRDTYMVVARDRKALLIESEQHILAKALKAVK